MFPLMMLGDKIFNEKSWFNGVWAKGKPVEIFLAVLLAIIAFPLKWFLTFSVPLWEGLAE